MELSMWIIRGVQKSDEMQDQALQKENHTRSGGIGESEIV
jgi:hypothetical protein